MKRARKPFLIFWIRSSFFKSPTQNLRVGAKSPASGGLPQLGAASQSAPVHTASASSVHPKPDRPPGRRRRSMSRRAEISTCPQSPPRARAARETCASHKARSAAAQQRAEKGGRGGIKQPGGPIGVFHDAFSSRSMKRMQAMRSPPSGANPMRAGQAGRIESLISLFYQ